MGTTPDLPAPGPPLLHDSYGVELDRDSDDLYVDKVYTFVGPVMRVRSRYVNAPEGDIQHSTYTSCEVEVEGPIVWNQHGFSVLHTVTAWAKRGDFVRDEQAPSKDGSRNASSDKKITSCWVTLLAGDYEVDERSTASTEGRPKDFRLTEPGGEIFVLQAVPQPSASDLVEVVDRHFWR